MSDRTRITEDDVVSILKEGNPARRLLLAVYTFNNPVMALMAKRMRPEMALDNVNGIEIFYRPLETLTDLEEFKSGVPQFGVVPLFYCSLPEGDGVRVSVSDMMQGRTPARSVVRYRIRSKRSKKRRPK